MCLPINIKNKPSSFVKGRFLSYGTKTLVNSVTLVNKIKTKPGRIALHRRLFDDWREKNSEHSDPSFQAHTFATTLAPSCRILVTIRSLLSKPSQNSLDFVTIRPVAARWWPHFPQLNSTSRIFIRLSTLYDTMGPKTLWNRHVSFIITLFT